MTKLFVSVSHQELLFHAVLYYPNPGHFRQDKTLNWLMACFFLAGHLQQCSQVVCNMSQLSADESASHPKSAFASSSLDWAPLWERIGMNLVGPLDWTGWGHRFVLALVDYATQYPETMCWCNISVCSVVETVFYVISHVSIPKEILTDQVTTFMSYTLCKLYKL